jgi:SPP1 gp7 family putative phage head morphogenesis protein
LTPLNTDSSAFAAKVGLDPTPEDKNFRIQEMSATMGSQAVLSLNEARERFQGLGSVDGGDTVKVATTFTDLGAPVTDEHQGQDNVKGKARRRAPKTRHARNAEFRRKLSNSIADRVAERLAAVQAKRVDELTHDEYDVLIKRLAGKVSKYEDAVAAAVREQNAVQREQVLSNLAKLFKKSRKSKVPELFDAAVAASAMRAAVLPLLVKLGVEQVPAAAEVIGSATVTPETISALADAIDAGVQLMAATYQQTTLDQLREKLAEGIEAGDGYAATAEVVAQIYDFADEKRAEMVAKTETNRAFNAANRATWQSLGVKTLVWHTSSQDNVCPFCASLDGTEIGIDDSFFEKGATLTLDTGQSYTFGYSDVQTPPAHPLCNCQARPGDVGSVSS